MPLFAVHAQDKPDALPRRLDLYTAHRTYREAAQDRGLILPFGGPLQSDDGAEMVGSFFIVEAPDRAAVEDLVQADPFMQGGV